MALKPLRRDENWIVDGKPTKAFADLVETLIREVNDMTTNAQLFRVRPADTNANSVYTAPASNQRGRGTTIKQFTASDPAAAATFNVYIGTTASAATKVVHGVTASAAGVSVSQLENALVRPGESIFVEASAANTIVFIASGNERTD